MWIRESGSRFPQKKKKKIEFSESGFPPKNKKKKKFKKKKKKKNLENVDPRIRFWFSTKKKKK